MTHNEGRKPIVIGHPSASGDLKINLQRLIYQETTHPEDDNKELIFFIKI